MTLSSKVFNFKMGFYSNWYFLVSPFYLFINTSRLTSGRYMYVVLVCKETEFSGAVMSAQLWEWNGASCPLQELSFLYSV